MTKKINNDCNRLELALQKEILSFKEAMAYLDLSKSMLYKLTSNKLINFSKPNNGRIYFKKSDLNNWALQNVSQSVDIGLQEKARYNHTYTKRGY